MSCNEPPEGPPIDWDSVQITVKACAKAAIYSPAWFPKSLSVWWIEHLIEYEEKIINQIKEATK